MVKNLMNEADRYLLKNWGEATLLEESMGGVRKKCAELIDRVADGVQESHPELDSRNMYRKYGRIALGRKSWPHKDNNTLPPALWMWNLSPDQLTAEDEDPVASLRAWKKFNIDIPAARALIRTAAETVLSPEERQRTSPAEGDDENLIYFGVPSKDQLLSVLTEGDGQQFVELLVSQFDFMARFVPVLDRVFQECMKGSA